MHSVVPDLFRLDLLASRRWFEKSTLWKSVIALAFIIVLVGVGLVIYYFSAFYFKYLLDFEMYGRLTVGYVLRATILVIAWVGIISSFVSTLSFLLAPNKLTDFLVTGPIDPLDIVSWHTIKTFSLNLGLLMITIFPMSLAYFTGSHLSFLVIATRSILVLIALSVFVESIGSTFAYLLSSRLKSKEGSVFALAAFIIFSLGTIFIFSTIFPTRLAILESVNIENFSSTFAQLPLFKCFIADSLSSVLETGINTSFILVSVITALIFIFALMVQKMLFISVWQQARLDLYLPKARFLPSNILTQSLIKKDILSILRTPKEFSYGVFLFFMLSVFMILFTRGIEVSRIPVRFTSSAVVFSWFWLIFYSGTYIIRLVFPLMARESRVRWWLFTLPLRPGFVVAQKVKAALLISSPLLVVAAFEWILSPFKFSSPFLLIMGFLIIVWLSIALVLMGMVKPDYSQGDEPEKVSTGFAGLSALGLVVIGGASLSYLIDLSARGVISTVDSLSILFVLGLLSLIPFYLLADHSVKTHTIET